MKVMDPTELIEVNPIVCLLIIDPIMLCSIPILYLISYISLQLYVGDINMHSNEFDFKKALDLLHNLNKVCRNQ